MAKNRKCENPELWRFWNIYIYGDTGRHTNADGRRKREIPVRRSDRRTFAFRRRATGGLAGRRRRLRCRKKQIPEQPRTPLPPSLQPPPPNHNNDSNINYIKSARFRLDWHCIKIREKFLSRAKSTRIFFCWVLHSGSKMGHLPVFVRSPRSSKFPRFVWISMLFGSAGGAP